MGKGNKKRVEKNGTVIYQTNHNCQQFSGPISGCVFAMPGAIVNQSPVQQCVAEEKEEDAGQTAEEKEDEVVNQLKPMFFGNEAEARDFLACVQGMKPKQITEKVNLLVAKRKISDLSRKRDLWRVLHECGIYTPSESNWNSMVK